MSSKNTAVEPTPVFYAYSSEQAGMVVQFLRLQRKYPGHKLGVYDLADGEENASHIMFVNSMFVAGNLKDSAVEELRKVMRGVR